MNTAAPLQIAYLFAIGAVALIGGGSVAYLLTLLGAATKQADGGVQIGAVNEADLPRIAIIVPAHNEELVLHATLASLKAQRYPAGKSEIVVMADNCTDTTAEIGRATGVTVIERFNKEERGKGYALAEATRQLLARPAPADIFVIVDADTHVDPDFLARMAREVRRRADARGRCALQGRYGVLNAGETWRAALMAGAFDLFNHVKPLGRDRLGLSVGLKGNGMAFTRQVLEIAPFSGRSITEDIDYGLDLLRHHGLRVGYVPDALVRAQMPTTAKQAESQRERWEGGRYKLLRERALPLLGEGLRKADRRMIDAAVDLMVPPLAETAALLLLWVVLAATGLYFGLLPGASIWLCAGVIAFAGFVLYVLAGFKVAGAPRAAYAALLQAPGYAIWKFALYALKPLRRLSGNGAKKAAQAGPEEWVRTERAAINPPPGGEEKAAP